MTGEHLRRRARLAEHSTTSLVLADAGTSRCGLGQGKVTGSEIESSFPLPPLATRFTTKVVAPVRMLLQNVYGPWVPSGHVLGVAVMVPRHVPPTEW